VQTVIEVHQGVIAYSGKVYTSKSGRQHVKGSFQALHIFANGSVVPVPSDSEPEGRHLIFSGKFKD